MFDNYGNQPAQAAPPLPPPNRNRTLRFDRHYVATKEGILKILQLVSNSIGFICIKISSQFLSAIFYNLVYWVGNIVTLFLILMYLFHFVEKYDSWPWAKYEFFFSAVMSLTYICCSIFATTIGEGVGYAVGFFGFCAVVTYGIDGYFKYKSWKRGLPPQ